MPDGLCSCTGSRGPRRRGAHTCSRPSRRGVSVHKPSIFRDTGHGRPIRTGETSRCSACFSTSGPLSVLRGAEERPRSPSRRPRRISSATRWGGASRCTTRCGTPDACDDSASSVSSRAGRPRRSSRLSGISPRPGGRSSEPDDSATTRAPSPPRCGIWEPGPFRRSGRSWRNSTSRSSCWRGRGMTSSSRSASAWLPAASIAPLRRAPVRARRLC